MKDQARHEVVIAEDHGLTTSDEEELGTMDTILQCKEGPGESKGRYRESVCSLLHR